MPSQTGGQLAAFIVRTENVGGPTSPRNPTVNDMLRYWRSVAEFWGDKHDELEAMLAAAVAQLNRKSPE